MVPCYGNNTALDDKRGPTTVDRSHRCATQGRGFRHGNGRRCNNEEHSETQDALGSNMPVSQVAGVAANTASRCIEAERVQTGRHAPAQHIPTDIFGGRGKHVEGQCWGEGSHVVKHVRGKEKDVAGKEHRLQTSNNADQEMPTTEV